MSVTLVGLGVCSQDISVGALKEAKNADVVYVRTALTPSVKSLEENGINYTSLDYLFEKSRNFDSLSKNIANEVIKSAKTKKTVFCVDGAVHEDNACKIIIKKCKDALIFDGVSKISSALSKLNLTTCAYSTVSAYELNKLVRATCPLVVFDLDSAFVAGDVSLALSELFGDEEEIFFIHGGKSKKMKIYEIASLSEDEYDYSSMVFVPELELLKKKRFDYDDLVELVRRLRAPDGCPWDRAQSEESIRANIIEEAYELVNAIDEEDDEHIMEEAGDVLLQACFSSVIKEEENAFTNRDVLSGLCSKLIFRHSHIFGTDKAENSDEALSVWEKNKNQEKQMTTISDSIAAIPVSFPALMKAQKFIKRASKAHWSYNFEGACGELMEEYEELSRAMQGDGKVEEEVGDLLMSAVHVGYACGVNCEQALSDSLKKIMNRFYRFEEMAIKEGKNVTKLTRDEWWEIYRKVKSEECR